MYEILTQGIGYLALLFVILSFQRKSRNQLLFIMLMGVALFVVHYAMLGAWAGSLANLIEAGIIFIAYKKETKTWAKSVLWLYLAFAAYAIAGIFTVKEWMDVLPIIAQAFGAIAVWQKNARAIRFLMLIPRPLWFTYNLVVGSQAGVITEVLILGSVLVGIVRFDVLPLWKRKTRH